MTAPVWMALPPEVHSTLLSGGPGPGPLLAAASAWDALSDEYATVASQLTSVVDGTRTQWQGPSAVRYASAHAAYVAWLDQQAFTSAAMGAQHQRAAMAYSAATAAMPTMAELVSNRAMHGVLVGTNFFGVNTIPIAVNEADYLGMWTQAATVMTIYQIESQTALATIPLSEPPPPVLTRDTSGSSVAAGFTPALSAAADEESLWNRLLLLWYQALDTIYALAWNGKLTVAVIKDPIGFLLRFLADFAANPISALFVWSPVFFFIVYNTIGWPFWGTVYALMLASPALIAVALALAAFSVLQEGVGSIEAVIPPHGGATLHAETVPAFGGQLGSSGIGVTSTTSAPAQPASSPATSGNPALALEVPYAVAGFPPPHDGFGPTLHDADRAPSPAAGIAASAVAASRNQRRRRSRKAMADDVARREFAFATVDSEPASPDPDPALVSQVGAGFIGATAGVPENSVKLVDQARASGLIAVESPGLGNDTSDPVVPGTWSSTG